jgi:pimeloyl-ACP methyl ester carboxylesterase
MGIFKDSYIQIDNLAIRKREIRKNNNIPFVYFHIYTGFAEEADEYATMVSEQYPFISFDARGHGQSEWGPADSYTPNNYYKDAVAAINSIDSKKIILMGSSFGAATAIKYASQNPDKIYALIIDDQPPEFPAARTKEPLLKSYERQKLDIFDSVDQVVLWAQKLRSRHFGWNISDEKAKFWSTHATKSNNKSKIIWRHDPEIMKCLAPFAGLAESDLRKDYANLKIPFMVARRLGEGASLLSPVWEQLQKLNPNGIYTTYEKAGHPVIFTEAKTFAKDTITFLNNINS